MSGQELPNVITKVSTADMLLSMARTWDHVWTDKPTRSSLDVLGAQWALETGWGKSMHCFNVGNVKAKPGGSRDWTYFACNEILTSNAAHHLQRLDPEHAKITQDNGKTATIWFYPKHSGCCFRAFKTLDEGAADYLALLYHRFSKAWPAVIAGDPESFSKILHDLHYYTASVALYTSAMKRVYTSVAGVKVNLAGLLAPTEDDRARTLELMKMSADDSAHFFSLENDAPKVDALDEV
jgi:hypothetical protein